MPTVYGRVSSTTDVSDAQSSEQLSMQMKLLLVCCFCHVYAHCTCFRSVFIAALLDYTCQFVVMTLLSIGVVGCN